VSLARAQRLLLERLGAGATALLSLHLAVPDVDWADGPDAEGRAVYLVNAHALRQLPDGEAAVQAVLTALREGYVPESVLAVGYAPAASAAWAEVVMGAAEQVLVDGPRASGKTQVEPAMLAGLAERHARAGFPLPLRASWLHTSLVNADAKTRPSLEQAHWGGHWTFRDDGRTAVLTVGGVELVHALVVGTQDQTTQERLRVETHVTFGEELIASLDEAGGIEERKFDLARNSARLPTPRRVAVGVTNPGDIDCWPFKRFIEGGGQPGCVRCPVPAADRLTPEEAQRQIDDFAGSPDLQARLGRGEWSALKLGELVAEGYDPAVHVAARRLEPSPDHVLAIGWDGGHSPSAVIGQLLGGQVRIYAALNDLKVGVLELIEDQVLPWLMAHAPWWEAPGAVVHAIDPSMATGSEATIRQSSERTIRDTIGGRVVKGAPLWPPRREAVLRVLAPRHEGGVTPLAISPTPETALLRQALSSRWYYPQTPDGRVDRSRPRKPNSPWADIGDAAAYLLGWLRPGAARAAGGRPAYQARSAVSWAQRPRREMPLPSDMQGARIIRTPNR
jgi:hypothetical protein